MRGSSSGHLLPEICIPRRRLRRGANAPSSAPERNPQNPGALVPGDGRLVAKALANLEPGEPLCICYGPADLIAWDLDKRRAYLAQHCGFRCVCARCLLEEEQAARSSR